MGRVYVWQKYSVVKKYKEQYLDVSTSLPDNIKISNITIGTSYKLDTSTGIFTLENTKAAGNYTNDALTHPYAMVNTTSGTTIYKAPEGSSSTKYWAVYSHSLSVRINEGIYGPSRWHAVLSDEKGNYIEDVRSENESAYPKDGVSGGYYYVYSRTFVEVNSIAVADAVMIGQKIPVVWTAADGGDSYKLERKVDAGGWTQVYEGDELSYTDTAGNWTSAQYRVSVRASGVYGDPKESVVVKVIPASALVISGTDGNLGTIKAPVAYSVTSDTGNQITVTEIVNGHERTLTPTSGHLITIPVSMLDPGAGAITIKASVQAASGIVNQTRSWTYTKTPLALPVDPYRVERMQGKECDIFPQTLAEAVMMPDGSSVADKLGVALEGAAIGTFTSSVTLPFTPDAVWVVCGSDSGSTAVKSSMLYPNIGVYIQVDFGTSNVDVIKWDGNTKISKAQSATSKYPYRYVALKFGGGAS